jgi:hypothetical protein
MQRLEKKGLKNIQGWVSGKKVPISHWQTVTRAPPPPPKDQEQVDRREQIIAHIGDPKSFLTMLKGPKYLELL